jgi:hypothetical protein
MLNMPPIHADTNAQAFPLSGSSDPSPVSLNFASNLPTDMGNWGQFWMTTVDVFAASR